MEESGENSIFKKEKDPVDRVFLYIKNPAYNFKLFGRVELDRSAKIDQLNQSTGKSVVNREDSHHLGQVVTRQETVNKARGDKGVIKSESSVHRGNLNLFCYPILFPTILEKKNSTFYHYREVVLAQLPRYTDGHSGKNISNGYGLGRRFTSL